MKRDDIIGGALITTIIGGWLTLAVKCIVSDNEKNRVQQKYIMEHPEEYKFYKDVTNTMKIEREAEHYKNAYNTLSSEVGELRGALKVYLEKDIEKLNETKNKYFGTDD